MKTKFLICLSFVTWGYFSNGQDLMPSLVGPSSYLSELKKELQQQWPNNRTINLVFHGHSVPAGYFKTPVVNTMAAYPYQVIAKLKEIYPHAVINIIVTAIGGENSVKGALRFNSEVLTHNPDVLFIDYGLNDRGCGLQAAFEAWSTMIVEAQKKNIKVILLTPSPDQRVDYANLDNKLKQHRDQIVRLSQQYNVGLIDSYGAFEFLYPNRKKLKKYMSQVNHPNTRGHELIANATLKWFK